MSGTVLGFDRVSKFYGQVLGVSDLSIRIGEGVVGLLGMNGAGKTTMIRLASGLLSPELGEVRVFGECPRRSLEARSMIGLCPEVDRFYERMSGAAWVEFMARLRGVPRREARRRARDCMELVGMAEGLHKKIGAYSKGMRQRTKLAQALVTEPRLLLLDEPLTGLDPVGRHEMVDLIRKLGREGRSLLVSSHILSEVELMTEELLFVHQGRLMAHGKVGEIRDQLEDRPHKAELGARNPRELGLRLLERGCVEGIDIEEDRILARFRNPGKFLAEVTELGGDAENGILSLVPLDTGVDAVFDYLVKKK